MGNKRGDFKQGNMCEKREGGGSRLPEVP